MAAGETLPQKYFRYRGWIPMPLYVALLAPLPWRSREEWMLWGAIGLGVVAIGSLFRLWAIRHIGKSARTRTEKLRPLIFSGPYAIMRNPLYVANIVIAAGFALAAGLPWYAPVLALLLFIHYHIVILCEEQLLLGRHEEDYASFLASTPRWFPRRVAPAFRDPAPHALGEALYRERSGLLALAVTIALIAAAVWFYSIR